MKDNLLLISCRSSFLDDDKIYPPLGLLYLHQSIKEEYPNMNVKITDEPTNEDISIADFIGVSIMTPQRKIAEELKSKILDLNPTTVTIAGGPHVKHYLEDMLDSTWDFLVPYDGVRAINKIITHSSQERIIKDFIGQRDYREMWPKPNRLDNAEFLSSFHYQLQGKRSTTMLTAQGCPEHCTFCEDAKTAVRWTPFNTIQEELDEIESLGYEGIYLFDDIFALSMKMSVPIAEEIGRRGLIYRCNGQARRFSSEFAQLLAETGCVEMAFGAESGSQKILDNIQKRCTVQQNYELVKWAQESGIEVKAFLMIGLPGETYETIEATEQFIRNSGINDFQLAVYYPYKGTQIRDNMTTIEGFEIGGHNDIYLEREGLGAYGQKGGSTEAVVRTTKLSSQDLLRERDRIVNTYRPKSHELKWQMHDQHIIQGGDQ